MEVIEGFQGGFHGFDRLQWKFCGFQRCFHGFSDGLTV